ncbi:thiamine pyrophosphate-dependent enzyme [Candidatus Phytoplasma phoenicium]|uniref:2-oxoisovalerate dehydrogenase subunit alpha n=1 Tax=Candidatus Phytoplasma phoenicium TaxID=198422 RepID=A0A0L0MK89_9MOLU|nr:thiamine pyrophosphate-dependent enzyme [Candidatus Phytoplasma phoenicium]KND62676.1 Pyruvate dehydrogenase E1 component alpha subunit [Candidatus Phytoplasma phoenicium]
MNIIFDDLYNPLKKKQLQILDINGEIINEKLEPKISNDQLLDMYKKMVLTRIADVKAVQYQQYPYPETRMLNYIVNKGHEACQIGTGAALQKQDWISPYFRDLGLYLSRNVDLEQIYLYWYGHEKGSQLDPAKRILPVNIIIGSGINIGAGLAIASKIQSKNEVTIATIGDGGTSHEEFYSGLNLAASMDAPLVVLIQNNQYAISTPRQKATKAETLAQKAYAFGIPGIQVDGNDVLAVYTAVKEFTDAARQGKGTGLIEMITYRMGAHSTNDDPNLYRSKEEAQEWETKDPIKRFQKYLLNKKVLNPELITQIEQNTIDYVNSLHKKILTYGVKIEIKELFEYVYKDMTQQLKEQYLDYETFLKYQKEGK